MAAEDQTAEERVKSIPLPISYFMSASGYVIPDLGEGTEERPWLLLDLHPDGSVTWHSVLKEGIEQ